MAPERVGVSRLVCVGLGYCAAALGRRLQGQGWSVAGSARTAEAVSDLRAQGFEAALFTGEAPGADMPALLASATHLLLSAPPDDHGDPLLRHHRADLARASRLRWIGYLSTVGVYGGWDGAWVDEATAPKPTSPRAQARVAAEQAWLAFGADANIPTHVFRLAGIYGPGRNALLNVREGRARRVIKRGQVFNRIHVADIAATLEASIAKPHAGAVYNVADDEPAPPQDPIVFAAGLLGVAPPPEVPFEQAELSPAARGFYGESKRVRNARIKTELGVRLAYPTYREGLTALAEDMR